MAVKVTLEGSRITPSDKLPAGVRSTVLLTDRVQRLIDRGFVVVISREELPDEEPVEAPDVAPESGSDSGAGEGDGDPELTPDPDADTKPDPESAEKPSRTRRGTKTADAPEE